MSFQAKDIQKIIDLSKIRREYIARVVEIVPEVDKVVGTGHAHLYSLRNLIEFAIADKGLRAGLSADQTSFLLAGLREYERRTGVDPFDAKGLRVVFIGDERGGVFAFDGPSGFAIPYRQEFRLNALAPYEDVETGESLLPCYDTQTLVDLVAKYQREQRLNVLLTAAVLAYMTVNISAIVWETRRSEAEWRASSEPQ